MSHEPSGKELENTVFKHKRTGRLYAFVVKAKLEMSGEEVVVYRSLKSGRVWVRPSVEFFDGRYAPTSVENTHSDAPNELMRAPGVGTSWVLTHS